MEKFSCVINKKCQLQFDEAKALQEHYSNNLSENISNKLLQFSAFSTDENKLIPHMFSMLKEQNLSSAIQNLESE